MSPATKTTPQGSASPVLIRSDQVILGGGTGLLVASMILGDEAPVATADFSPHR